MYFASTWLLPVVITTMSVAFMSASVNAQNTTSLMTFDNPLFDEAWSSYKTTYKKSYKNATIESKARKTWFKTMGKIILHNLFLRHGKSKYSLGVNKYSDVKPRVLVSRRNRLFLTHDKILEVHAYVQKKKLEKEKKEAESPKHVSSTHKKYSGEIDDNADDKNDDSGSTEQKTKQKTKKRTTLSSTTIFTTTTTTNTTTKTTKTTTKTTKPCTKTSSTKTTKSTVIVPFDFSTPPIPLTAPPPIFKNKTIVAPFSWVDMGFVTPVKDQGLCGCCFAFSAIGSLEGQWFRKTGQLISLAEQQLVDCVYPGTGCEGGNMNDAYDYIAYSKGIQDGTTYPYDSYYGDQYFSCRYDPQKAVANDTGEVQLPAGDEVALLEALKTNGPIATGIDGSVDTFLK